MTFKRKLQCCQKSVIVVIGTSSQLEDRMKNKNFFFTAYNIIISPDGQTNTLE